MAIKQMKLSVPTKAGATNKANAVRANMAAAFNGSDKQLSLPPRKKVSVFASGATTHTNPLDGDVYPEDSKTKMRERDATIPLAKLGSEHMTDLGGRTHGDPLSTVIAASSSLARRSALRPKRGTPLSASAPNTHTPEEDGSAGLENGANTNLKGGKEVAEMEKMVNFSPDKSGGRTHQNLDGGNSLVNAGLNGDDGEFGDEEPTMETGAIGDDYGYGDEGIVGGDEDLGEGWDTGAPGAMLNNDIEGIGLGDDMGSGSLNPLPPVSVEPDWSEGGEYTEPNMLNPENIVLSATEDGDDEELTNGDAEETVALLDADETPDDATEDVVVAMVGTSVHAMLGNRIIATITQRAAVKASLGDVYRTDGFADAVIATVQKRGLRNGLKDMSFTLATIKPSKKSVVEARIRAGIQQKVAQVQAAAKQERAVFEQSLAIASVGIRKRYFAGVSNPLAEGLTAALTQAGVIDAAKVVASAFDMWGVPYTKNVFALASNIAQQDPNSRKAYIAALDIISDDTTGIVAGEEGGEDIQEDLATAFSEPVDETTAATAVTATFSRPGRAHNQVALQASLSQDVNAILFDGAPLTFM